MRKIWIVSGWFLYVAGGVMVVTMGLAWLGGEKPVDKMISGIVMGCLFIFLGHHFVARGRSLPICTTFKDSEAARNDQIAARRMIAQAIWIGAFIVLAVGLIVGLLLFLAGRSTGYPAERTTAVSRGETKADRVIIMTIARKLSSVPGCSRESRTAWSDCPLGLRQRKRSSRISIWH